MGPRDDFGVTVILEPRRRVDWTEPPAEGDHQLLAHEAGDDD